MRLARRDESRAVWSSEKGDLRKAAPEGGPPSPSSGGRGGVRLRLDRRASDRVVTLVAGLPGSPAEISALARELKATCGTGGTVKDGVLELQGDHRAAVEAVLARKGLRSKRAGG